MPKVLLTVAAIIIAVAAFVGFESWSAHHAASSRDSLANGYNTQSLSVPFQLQSKSWQGDHWVYNYVANESEAQALADAKSQFGRGAYQVVASKPDTISGTQATLYRDLITEDVAVTAQIGPSAGASTPVTLTLRAINQ